VLLLLLLRPPAAGSAPGAASELDRVIPQVVTRARPSIVTIVVVRSLEEPASRDPGFRPSERGSGSGVIISSEGHILTNWHVIEGGHRFTVRLWDGRELPARVCGADPATDLAVLQVRGEGLVPARLGDSDRLEVGQLAIAVGQPFGLSGSVTFGVISGKGRYGFGAVSYEDYIQTDAEINPGNSGGPLLNTAGEVIGINTMFIGAGQGLGFAIPINMAREVARQLIETGEVVRPYVGVAMQDLTSELAEAFGYQGHGGALINKLYDDGPARDAGLQRGDIIIRVGGVSVASPRDVVRQILRHRAGQQLAFTVFRAGSEQTIRVPLARLPQEKPDLPALDWAPSPSGSRLGIAFHDLTFEEIVQHGFTITEGVILSEVERGSPAELAGLQAGDAISEVNGRPVRNTRDLLEAIRLRTLGEGHLILAHRGSENFYTVIKD
jgi:Do/DeqQ family serine protease